MSAKKTERSPSRRLYNYWKKHDFRGFFPIPWEEGCWSASILVKAYEDPNNRRSLVEWGGMWYVLGEALYEWDGRIAGEYYPFLCRGEHDHEHSFFGVLRQAILNDGAVEAEKQESCYAPWMLEQLEAVRTDPNLRNRACRYSDPEEMAAGCPQLAQPILWCMAEGKLRSCQNIDQVYELAAQYPHSFSLDGFAHCYSQLQRDCIDGVLSYQRSALTGEAP